MNWPLATVDWVLVGFGAWFVLDGTVSATYFAHVDKTTKNWQDQAVRVVRTVLGIGLIIIGFFF